MPLFDFLKPRWQRANPADRVTGVLEVRDPDVLERLARTDPVAEVRLAAIDQVDDEQVRYEVARDDADPAVCRVAMRRIEDRGLLGDLVARGKGVFDREVLKRLDEPSLVTVAGQDGDPEIRIAAMRRIKDPETRDRAIAALLAARDERLRTVAVQHSRSQGDLRRVLAEETAVPVLEILLDRLQDPELRAEFCIRETDERLEHNMIQRLADHPDALRRVAAEARRESTRRLAVVRIDPTYLDVDLYEREAALEVRREMVSRSEDPEMLARAATRDDDDLVRRWAIRKLTDETLLRSIAENDPDELNRATARGRLEPGYGIDQCSHHWTRSGHDMANDSTEYTCSYCGYEYSVADRVWGMTAVPGPDLLPARGRHLHRS